MDMKKTGITAIFMGILATIIIMNLIGETAPIVADGTELLTDESRCEAVGCFYNGTDATIECGKNATFGTAGRTTVCKSGFETVPMNGLWGSNGVVMLTIMGALLIVVAVVMFGIAKK